MIVPFFIIHISLNSFQYIFIIPFVCVFLKNVHYFIIHYSCIAFAFQMCWNIPVTILAKHCHSNERLSFRFRIRITPPFSRWLVDPFILTTPRGISHDHEQVRFKCRQQTLVSCGWFDFLQWRAHLSRTKNNFKRTEKMAELDSCRLDLTQ